MRKIKFNPLIAVVLVISMIIPMFTVLAPIAIAANGEYQEDGNWMNTNSNSPTDYAYSIAVVGDTQSIVVEDLTNGTNYMSSIYSWIADSVEDKSIQYVLGVGDITEFKENFDSTWEKTWEYSDEWDHAKSAITLLDGKVPYSLCRGGGHDTIKKFNEYFASHDYYTSNLSGTYAAGDVTSSYSMFEVGSVEYLILALDWNPSDDILAWAEGIIAANPTRRVIITTHAYLAADGTLHGSSTSHTSVPTNNNGVDIYEKLVSKYDNIQLVISGHNPSANIVYRQDARDSGSVVTSLLVDPQAFDSQNDGETGMVCMLYFSEDGNTMSVEWISTVREQYYKAQNQFTLKLNEMPDEEGNILTQYGVIPAKYADVDAYPFLAFQGGELLDLGSVTYDAFIDASGCMGRALRKITTGGEITIIARKNFTVTSGGYMYTNYWSLPVVVDLMGYTIDAKAANNLLSANATQTFDTDLTIKNGTILLSNAALMTVSTGGADKTQSFTLENLDIISENKQLMIFNQYKTAGNVNINFNNCDITIGTAFAGNVFRSGNSGDSNKLISAAVKVCGGSVTLPSFDANKFVQEYNGSTVNFLPDSNGEMLKVILPTGTSVAEKAYKDKDGNSVYLVKSAVTETTDEYLLESLVTPYGTIPYAYSDKVTYPFLAFTNKGFVELSAGKSYDLFYGNVSGTIERTTRFLSGITEVNVIMRADYEVIKHSGVSGTGQLLTNYQKVPFNIDLMGYTLTSMISLPMFGSNGAGSEALNTVLTVKNGKIVSNKSLVTVANKPGVEGKVQSFIFDNVDINISDTGLVIYNTTNTNIAGSYNFTYKNCDINGQNLAYVFSASNSNGYIANTMTVEGGSVTLSQLNTSRFAVANEGCSVTFLPGENGEYTTLRLLNSTEETLDVNCTTDKGELDYVLLDTEGSYGVYVLRGEEKLVTPKVSLTIQSGFTYNVYVPVEDYVTAITVNGTAVDLGTLATKEIEGKSYYHVTVDVSVIKTAEAIALTVTTDAQSQSWTLDVIDYAEALATGNYDGTTEALAYDILAYIRAAYVYANVEDTAKAVERIDAVIGEDYVIDPDTTDVAKHAGDGIASSGLFLTETPVYVFYPEMNGDGTTKYDVNAYKFSVNGEGVTKEVDVIEGKVAILVYTYAASITETVSYTIEGTDISGEYNLAAYLAYTETLGDANLVALVNALWQYSDSAKAYIEAHE